MVIRLANHSRYTQDDPYFHIFGYYVLKIEVVKHTLYMKCPSTAMVICDYAQSTDQVFVNLNSLITTISIYHLLYILSFI